MPLNFDEVPNKVGMSIDEYQKWTRETSLYPGTGTGSDSIILSLSLGIGEESGEMLGKVKKYHRGDYPYADLKKKLILEAGDLSWYLARICDELGVNMSQVLEKNVEKLKARVLAKKVMGDGDDR